MIIKGLIDEDFVNYKTPCMYIAFHKCSFKCDHEAGCSICQNSRLTNNPDIEISSMEIVSRYIKNPITKAIVMSGLEPFDSRIELYELIKKLRQYTGDVIIIYTGYNEDEIQDDLNILSKWDNIIVKFGRFIPNQEKHYDEVLGVELASLNQYARRIS